ncbi:MAG: hypothetical protein IAE94_03290 [Chthoniobacterales bacterium]|nr:hypothetical protein [Chthoniobacterales bacterium]
MKLSLSSLVFFSVFVLAMMPGLGRAESLLWAMDLKDQPLGPAPIIGENFEIREENGERFLAKVAEGTVFFPKTILSVQETQNWNDIIVRVRYREEERFGTALSVKRNGLRDGDNFIWYYVTVQADGITVSCHGLKDSTLPPTDPRLHSTVKFESIGAAALGLSEWLNVEARVGNEVIQVTVDNGDGAPRKAEFPTLPGAGGVQLLALYKGDFSSFSVHQSDTPIEAGK